VAALSQRRPGDFVPAHEWFHPRPASVAGGDRLPAFQRLAAADLPARRVPGKGRVSDKDWWGR